MRSLTQSIVSSCGRMQKRLRKRLRPYLIGLVGTGFFAAQELLRGGLRLVHFSEFAIIGVFVLPDLLGQFFDYPDLVADVFVHRVLSVSVVVGTCVTLAGLQAFVYRIPLSALFTLEGLGFFAIGVYLAVRIRSIAADYRRRLFFDEAQAGQSRMWLYVLVIVYLLLFRLASETREAPPMYLLGIGVGFLAHFGYRGFREERIRKERMTQNFFDRIRKLKLYEHERVAVEMYARPDLTALAEHFAEHEARMTPQMKVLQLSMLRFLGRHLEALERVNEELRQISEGNEVNNTISVEEREEFRRSLYLIRALCLGELDGDADLMFEDLDHAIRGKDAYPLAMVTRALRTTEKNWDPITGEVKDPAELEKAHIDICESRKSASDRSADLPELIVGSTAARPFFLVVYAYILLAAKGDLAVSRAILKDCLEVDWKFAPLYLIVGTWLITNGRLNAREKGIDSLKESMKVARLCLYIATKLEKHGRCGETLIQRQANELLKRIPDLLQEQERALREGRSVVDQL